MPVLDTVLPLPFANFSYVGQQEFDLSSLALELHDDRLHLIFPGGDKKPLTDRAFESLCRVIQVPFAFAKRLKDDSNFTVLTYLQKQMSLHYLNEPAIIVHDESTTRETAGHVLAVTTRDYILPSIHALVDLDKEILKTMAEFGKGTLVARHDENDGYLRYVIQNKIGKFSADDSEYAFGHVVQISVYGHEQPAIFVVATRLADQGMFTLPFKPEIFPAGSSTFTGDLLGALESLETQGWTDLEGFLCRLKAVKASLREVKETRQKLLKTLKVDKEDADTAERIEPFFGWKDLVAKYEIKTLTPKPSRKWFMSAPSHLNLLDVFTKLVAETTQSPIPSEKRVKLERYASKMLGRLPDLGEKEPPKGVV